MNPFDKSILSIDAGIQFDDSISRIHYQPYQPLASTAYGYADEIHFQIQNQDQYTYLPGSFLIIEGVVNKIPGSGTVSPAKFVEKNAIAFLFSECQYKLNGIEVDRTRRLGISSLMKGLCSLTRDEAQTVYHDAGWDSTYVNDIFPEGSTDNKVQFNACLPLKLLLGFAEDYNRIICGTRQDLVLVRARNDRDALVNATAVAGTENSNVEIKKITLMMPVIRVNDAIRINLLRITNGNRPLSMPFRSWDLYEHPAMIEGTTNVNWSVATSTQVEKPRYVIVGFQTKRTNSYTAETDKFDHLNIRDIKLFLNEEFYPYYNPNINFPLKQATFLYQMYAAFQKSYYNREYISPLVDRDDFISKYPLFVFDASRQQDRVKDTSPVDVRLEIQTNDPIPAGTACYCLIIHDKKFELNQLTNVIRRT